jgi:Tfp pilus assembly protein PilP
MIARSRTGTLGVAVLAGALGLAACEEDVPVIQTRGPPAFHGGGSSEGKGAEGKDTKPRGAAQPSSAAGAEAEEALPPRPPVTLDARSFARARDPFRSPQVDGIVVPEVERPKAQRKVQMAHYRFEDLKLIAVVNSGRGIVPRALFLASDGKSGTIRQGEYFSSAEVLLAAVNRDYVEIEVVDEDVASGLNLQRGERRAIYLRND